MKILSYILFPTEISKDTTVAIQAGDGLCFVEIEKDDKQIRLDLKEAREIAKLIDSIKEKKR